MHPTTEIRRDVHDPQQKLAGALTLFNWKTAAISAVLRALIFLFSNLRAGHSLALKASLVEASYAILMMGLLGGTTERIRYARPVWLTGLIVWIAIPALLLFTQYHVHRFFGTPKLRVSMIASFCFAALGTGFNWFAMRRGAFLVGDPLVGGTHAAGSNRSFGEDLRVAPTLIWEFVAAGPRALVRVWKK